MQTLAAVALGLLTAPLGQEPATQLGATFSVQKETPLSAVLTRAPEYHNKTIKLRGIVACVHKKQGWFVELVEPDGHGQGVLVSCPGAEHTFPLDCVGKTAIVEGLFYQKIYPAKRVAGWQENGFRPGWTVPRFSLIQRMSAKAVHILDKRAVVPPPAAITQASGDKVDLDVAEFEDDGFGTGRKVLKPGESTPEHTTGHAREMIFCLEGTLTVMKEENKRITISAGEMAYIPTHTRHSVHNESKADATYLFVFAHSPDPHGKPHEH